MPVFLLTSCEEDIGKRQAVFTATMPADDLSSSRLGCIINGEPAADGFNLNARWKNGDKIQIFVRQEGKVFQVESPSTVYDISSDGKTCSFQVTLPKSVKTEREYEVIGVTGAEAYIDGEDVVASCILTRVGIGGSGSVSLPLWFSSKNGSSQAKFLHICTYEVLYVNNNSESNITFKHRGFDVMTPWYKYSEKIVITNLSRYLSGGNGSNDSGSNEITIPAGTTGTIVSWYTPADYRIDGTTESTINNARLKAVVNGNDVTSSDALSSAKTLVRGNAYYMEINWNGETLYFSNAYCPDGHHPHIIDLGLPSGAKWACCNVGANTPTDYGDFFAWGETSPKSDFGEYNYKWYYNGDNHQITKYCCNSDYGTVDNRTELEPEDDAAYVNWGPKWSMPYLGAYYELMSNCTIEWTKLNGTSGCIFKSNTNNSAIFFPLAGWTPKASGVHTLGKYWTRNYEWNYDNRSYLAYILYLQSGNSGVYAAYLPRYMGANVRPVYVEQE